MHGSADHHATAVHTSRLVSRVRNVKAATRAPAKPTAGATILSVSRLLHCVLTVASMVPLSTRSASKVGSLEKSSRRTQFGCLLDMPLISDHTHQATQGAK